MITPTRNTTMREARRASGLSQQRLATIAGVSIGYVKRIEEGYRPVDPDGSPAYMRVVHALMSSDLSNDEEPASKAAVGREEVNPSAGRRTR